MLNKIYGYAGIAFFAVKFWFMVVFATVSFWAGMKEEDSLNLWAGVFFD
jgi:hypothetical protein